jgi:hypothetical protein
MLAVAFVWVHVKKPLWRSQDAHVRESSVGLAAQIPSAEDGVDAETGN